MACIKKRRGRYVIDFYDQLGARHWKTMPKGATKKEAEDEWDEIKKSIKNKSFIPEKRVPLFSKVAYDWLDYKKPNVRITTWEVMKGHIENHLLRPEDRPVEEPKGRGRSNRKLPDPDFLYLDSFRINRITIADIEKFISQRREKGINIVTLRKILVTLGQILSYAVRHRYIDHNPLRDAEKPRDPGKDKKEMQVLTPEQIRAFLDVVEDQKHKTLFLMAIMTGARQGELLGLKWTDLDMINNQVHIQGTFNNGQFFPTKTPGSNRRVDLSPTVMLELKKWKLACPKTEWLKEGDTKKEAVQLDLMFPNDAGGPIDKNNMMKRHFEPALKKAGVPLIRFHDLRHTYASLLLEQGENIKYIQSMLGHSSPTVTLNVYSHLMKPVNQEAVCRLENTIFEPTGSKMVAETKKELTPKRLTP